MAKWDSAPLLGENVAPPPPGAEAWQAAPAIEPPKTAQTFWEHLVAGVQGTGTAMLLTRKQPEYQIDPAVSPWYLRNAANAAGIIADVPAMAVGALAGAATRSPVAAGAGMMAAPAVLREAMTDYLQGKALNYWALTKTAGKEALIGAATFFVGGQVGKLMPGRAEIAGLLPGAEKLMTTIAERTRMTAYLTARGAAITAAEAGTMVASRGALEWRIPEGHEWVDAAVTIGGMKGTFAGVQKLQNIWRRTGVPPERVAEDARVDPEIKFDMLDETREIPRAYEHLKEPKSDPIIDELPKIPDADPRIINEVKAVNSAAEKAAAALEKAEGEALAKAKVEETRPGEATEAAPKPLAEEPPKGPLFDPIDPKAMEVFDRPFADVPADGVIPIGRGGKGLNIDYVRDADAAETVLARQIQVRQAEYEAAQGGTRSLEQMRAEAEAWLEANLGKKAVMDRLDPERRVSTAEILARRDVLVAAAEEARQLVIAAHAQRAKGIPLTPEQLGRFLAAEEQLRVYGLAFTGAKAEAGRILRVLQEQTTEQKRATAIAKALAKQEGRSPEEAKAGESAKEVEKGQRKLAEMEESVAAVEDAAKGGTAKEDAAAARTAADTAKKARKAREPKKLTEEELKAKEAELTKKKEEAEIKAKVEKLKRDRAEEKRLNELRDKLEAADDAGRREILAEELERTKAVEKAFKGTEKETELQQMLDDVSASIKDLRRSINENVPKAEKDAAMRRAIEEHGVKGVLETFNKLYGQWGRDRPTAADAADAAAIRRLTKERDHLAALKDQLDAAPDAAARDAILDAYAQGKENLAKNLLAAGKETERGTIASILKQDVAELKKALNEKTTRAERDAAIMREVNRRGGAKNLENFMLLLSEADAGALVKAAKPPTTIGKILEVWKSFLVSGYQTLGINMVGNVAFGAARIPVSFLKATLGAMRTGEDRVLFRELIGEAYGMKEGFKNGMVAAGRLLRFLDPAQVEKSIAGEGYAHTPQINGRLGEIVRYPFRTLEATDLVFRAMNEGATRYAEAYRRAITHEGLNENIHEAALKYLKDPDIEAHAIASGKKYTFTLDLGVRGQAMQRLVRDWPELQFVFPFIRTPTNIFKETAAYVPGLNLIMKEQRANVKRSGEAGDQILAQHIVGGALMGFTWMLVDEGYITGGGDPDPQKRATQDAAGFKPYRFMGVDYSQIAVLGTLMSLTADLHTVHEYMTRDELDHANRMLWFSFVQQVTNKNFVQGGVKMAAAIASPYEKADKFIEQLAASFVPGLVAQPSAAFDGYVREVHSVKDAIYNRIYWLRQGLPPKIDLWGQPIKVDERLWNMLPLKVSELTNDKVRYEAARLGLAAPVTPKKLDAVPGWLKQDVELTSEDRDMFARGAGTMAYEMLKDEVNAAGWDAMPDIMKIEMYGKVFNKARAVARAQVLEKYRDDAIEKAVADIPKDRSKPGLPRREFVRE